MGETKDYHIKQNKSDLEFKKDKYSVSLLQEWREKKRIQHKRSTLAWMSIRKEKGVGLARTTVDEMKVWKYIKPFWRIPYFVQLIYVN